MSMHSISPTWESDLQLYFLQTEHAVDLHHSKTAHASKDAIKDAQKDSPRGTTKEGDAPKGTSSKANGTATKSEVSKSGSQAVGAGRTAPDRSHSRHLSKIETSESEKQKHPPAEPDRLRREKDKPLGKSEGSTLGDGRSPKETRAARDAMAPPKSIPQKAAASGADRRSSPTKQSADKISRSKSEVQKAEASAEKGRGRITKTAQDLDIEAEKAVTRTSRKQDRSLERSKKRERSPERRKPPDASPRSPRKSSKSRDTESPSQSIAPKLDEGPSKKRGKGADKRNEERTQQLPKTLPASPKYSEARETAGPDPAKEGILHNNSLLHKKIEPPQ